MYVFASKNNLRDDSAQLFELSYFLWIGQFNQDVWFCHLVIAKIIKIESSYSKILSSGNVQGLFASLNGKKTILFEFSFVTEY